MMFWFKRQPDALVEQLLASIETEPDAWSFSQYMADHKSGAAVWFGSGDSSFISVYRRFPNGEYKPRHRDRRRLKVALRGLLARQIAARVAHGA